MKQEIISYLSTCKNDLFNLAKYLYDNPEESYHEYKSYEYIITFLKKYNFSIEENFLNIDTCFKANYGNGHPKICFICEYDAIKDQGHITGHNLVSEISIAAAIGLSKVIDKEGGSIVILGCAGEYLGGSKITMCKQGIFDDIDIVLMAHPDTITSESGTSSAILPLSLKFTNPSGFSFMNKNTFNSLDALLLSFNILSSLSKSNPEDTIINSIISEAGNTPLLIPTSSEGKFYIRSKNIKTANLVGEKIKNIGNLVTSLMKIESKISLYELPYDELITNSTLSRLFCHNLKESGIIDIASPRNIEAGLSLGTVSHYAPCIHPYVNIVNNSKINYGTKEFANSTLTEFAQDNVFKAAHALSFTAVDIIEQEQLLKEIKTEFFNKK